MPWCIYLCRRVIYISSIINKSNHFAAAAAEESGFEALSAGALFNYEFKPLPHKLFCMGKFIECDCPPKVTWFQCSNMAGDGKISSIPKDFGLSYFPDKPPENARKKGYSFMVEGFIPRGGRSLCFGTRGVPLERVPFYAWNLDKGLF